MLSILSSGSPHRQATDARQRAWFVFPAACLLHQLGLDVGAAERFRRNRETKRNTVQDAASRTEEPVRRNRSSFTLQRRRVLPSQQVFRAAGETCRGALDPTARELLQMHGAVGVVVPDAAGDSISDDVDLAAWAFPVHVRIFAEALHYALPSPPHTSRHRLQAARARVRDR